MFERQYSRRTFLQLLAGGAGLVLTACAPGGSGLLGRSPVPAATGRVGSPHPTPDGAAIALVDDVVDFTLQGPFEWNGGSVTMRLHAAFVDGEEAYFVRTDASDQQFAEQEQLVYVPLLAAALGAPEKSVAEIYLFSDGVDGQLPILSTVPGRDEFTSLYRVYRVSGARQRFDSADAVVTAADGGELSVEETNIVVNYPIVKWPDGELSVDEEVTLPLANGPLLSAPDVDAMTVTFKLHQCYPESRYIITDTSAVPMAPMMSIVGSPATAALIEAGATSKITVFGNGIAGPGAMGFQPAIFQAKAGDPAWSPMWDHWTALWKNQDRVRLLRSQVELDDAVAAGEIELHHGTPDTGGEGFVVNCPSPIIAPNDFEVVS